MLTFDADTHTYRVDGRAVTSVTTRIHAAGLPGSAAFAYTPASADRGTRVHLACLQCDSDIAPTLPEDERGYLQSYMHWRRMIGPVWERMEQTHYNPTFDTAGTADRLGTIDGVPTVLDLKTGGPAAWHGVQLAMYDLLYTHPIYRVRRGLYLRKDGTPARCIVYADPADYATALQLMTRIP